jgi:ribosome-associated protein
VTGAFQDPAGFPRPDVLKPGIILQIRGELIGESLGLFNIQKPVGAHESLHEEPFFVEADNAWVAGAFDLRNGEGESLAGGNCHWNFTYFRGETAITYADHSRITNPMATLRITASLEIPLSELKFEFSRSGGPGGQHVNKVATRVDLLFDVRNSSVLSYEQKGRIEEALGARIDGRGTLRLTAGGSRSQWKNREDAVRRFALLLRQALKPRVRRVPTKPSGSSREKRMSAKKIRGAKKRLRSARNVDL